MMTYAGRGFMMWIIEVLDDSDAVRQTFRIAPGEHKTLGRTALADFVIDAPLVSRVHCRLTATDNRLEIHDLESTNGTFVNDRPVKDAVLTSRDRVGLGRMTLRVTAHRVS